MLARTKYALVPAIRAQRLARRLAALLAVSTSAQADALGASWAHFGGPWPPFAVFALLSLAAIAMLAGTVHFRSLRRALRVEIAKRLTSETAAEEEKRRLNDILDHSRVGVLLVDRNCRHVDVNRSWSQMFGYRRREVRGKLAARDIAHPEDATALEEHFLGLLAGRSGALTQERRFVRKDGSSFWGLMSTSTVTNKAGGQMWVVAMITDIDAQKRAEQALRESEERLRFITESTQDVVWQLDRELRFTYVNAADERMRGYRRDEVIGRRFDENVDPAEYPWSNRRCNRYSVRPQPPAKWQPAVLKSVCAANAGGNSGVISTRRRFTTHSVRSPVSSASRATRPFAAKATRSSLNKRSATR